MTKDHASLTELVKGVTIEQETKKNEQRQALEMAMGTLWFVALTITSLASIQHKLVKY